MKTRELTTVSVLVALATVLHVIESFFPSPLPIPGAKLGLANIVTLLTLVLFGWKTGFLVAFLRIMLGSLLSGSLLTTGFFLSFAGAITSTLMMALCLYFFTGFSVIGVSVVGAVFHNLGQLAMAGLLIEHMAIFFYLPVLLLAAIPTGLFTGFILKYLLKHLKGIDVPNNLSDL
ncbi:Gx transporter family protein [Dehalobacterium formicoaceticum]|uniref:Gx transporter family protein n=1 Tax=Dehalobacterium formicoaceticum TaxID=51515 RepID=A0ABT1Y062_9FIRM|nr:Gx transporter family protein [Dehalobacterium formicoaceticum]MCR6544257.1 Gx transporter family protein [Dehalobacterium formicoaceticum]